MRRTEITIIIIISVLHSKVPVLLCQYPQRGEVAQTIVDDVNGHAQCLGYGFDGLHGHGKLASLNLLS